MKLNEEKSKHIAMLKRKTEMSKLTKHDEKM